MAQAIDFPGSNFVFGPPPGEGDRCSSLHVFRNGACIVSCWKLTQEEIDEIVKSGCVWLSNWSDNAQMTPEGPRPVLFPQFLGSESVVRSVVVDFGPIWKK